MILLFDVNGFKCVNDSFGHSYGDECLKKVAFALREAYADHGKCFRIGGDEFCAILDGDDIDVEGLNKRFGQLIEAERKHDGRFPNVSVGYGVFCPGKADVRAAIDEADRMMYGRKRSSTC